ncbi:hypothetical protein SmJEL517_g05119 [Synchytrium microbalum]|uniref:UBA domain-containing protein n=1 Tax=Synchytrium microbalum TaxID=1806994 RepID=A0A507C219_9FUNG|nr:uncharacterized protein SmJEL517_g05119 [Synchytrium microbalum]TPX31575.1 hypothetical protein SmJEL517_g05119 [Synchytrium microbalum]
MDWLSDNVSTTGAIKPLQPNMARPITPSTTPNHYNHQHDNLLSLQNRMQNQSSGPLTTGNSLNAISKANAAFDNLVSFGNSANNVKPAGGAAPFAQPAPVISSQSALFANVRPSVSLEDQRRLQQQSTPSKPVGNTDAWAAFPPVAQQFGLNSRSNNNTNTQSSYQPINSTPTMSSNYSSIPVFSSNTTSPSFGFQSPSMTATPLQQPMFPATPIVPQQQQQKRTPSPNPKDAFGDLLGASPLAGFGARKPNGIPQQQQQPSYSPLSSNSGNASNITPTTATTSTYTPINSSKTSPTNLGLAPPIKSTSPSPQPTPPSHVPIIPMASMMQPSIVPGMAVPPAVINSNGTDTTPGGGTWDWDFLAQPKPIPSSSISTPVPLSPSQTVLQNNDDDPFDVEFLGKASSVVGAKSERQDSNPLGILAQPSPVIPETSTPPPQRHSISIEPASPTSPTSPMSQTSRFMDKDHALAIVMGTGYEHVEAENALQASGGDPTLAIEMLIHQKKVQEMIAQSSKDAQLAKKVAAAEKRNSRSNKGKDVESDKKASASRKQAEDQDEDSDNDVMVRRKPISKVSMYDPDDMLRNVSNKNLIPEAPTPSSPPIIHAPASPQVEQPTPEKSPNMSAPSSFMSSLWGKKKTVPQAPQHAPDTPTTSTPGEPEKPKTSDAVEMDAIEATVSRGLGIMSSIFTSRAATILPRGKQPRIDGSNGDDPDYVEWGDMVPYKDDSDEDEWEQPPPEAGRAPPQREVAAAKPVKSSINVAPKGIEGPAINANVRPSAGSSSPPRSQPAVAQAVFTSQQTIASSSLFAAQTTVVIATTGPVAPVIPPQPVKPSKPVVTASPQQIATSDSFREKGNALFKQGQFGDAEIEYTQAITALPAGHLNLIAVFNNRAAARLKTGQFKEAIEDATAVLAIDDRDCKSLLRRASAYEAIERWADAREDYKTIMGIDTSVKGVSAGLSRCQKAMDMHQRGDSGSGSVVEQQQSSPLQRSSSPQQLKPRSPPPQQSSSSAFAFAEFEAPLQKPSASSGNNDFGMFSGGSASSSDKPTHPHVERAVKMAVDSLRQANQQAEADDAMKLALKDQIDFKINQWRHGKEANLRALLASMETVLWKDSKNAWQAIQMSELITPQQVKVKYMKAVSRVHPDKASLARDSPLEQQLFANAIFSTLNKAWDSFRSQNGM